MQTEQILKIIELQLLRIELIIGNIYVFYCGEIKLNENGLNILETKHDWILCIVGPLS